MQIQTRPDRSYSHHNRQQNALCCPHFCRKQSYDQDQGHLKFVPKITLVMIEEKEAIIEFSRSNIDFKHWWWFLDGILGPVKSSFPSAVCDISCLSTESPHWLAKSIASISDSCFPCEKVRLVFNTSTSVALSREN